VQIYVYFIAPKIKYRNNHNNSILMDPLTAGQCIVANKYMNKLYL